MRKIKSNPKKKEEKNYDLTQENKYDEREIAISICRGGRVTRYTNQEEGKEVIKA